MKKLLLPALLATSCAIAQQTATVTIDTGKVIHKVDEAEFHGINLVALWNGQDPVIDDASLNAYKQMGMKILRFPGGAPAQWYDWETPLKSGWTELTPQNVAEFAKKGGSRMMYQTNSASNHTQNPNNPNKKTGELQTFNNSGEHAANWVLAMNKEGIDVAWWEIGNEPEMDAPGEHKKSQEAVYEWYNAKYKEQVEAIKKADPKARVMGPSATNTWFWWACHNLDKFLQAHGDKEGTGVIDAISLHWYVEDSKNTWKNKRGAVQDKWPKAMKYIKDTMAKYDTRDLPLYITEWNWGGGMDNQSASMHANAMGVADAVGMFLRTGVAGHNFFCYKKVDNNWGVVASTGDNRPVNECAPTYYALTLASKLHGEVLETATTSDEANVMSAYATRCADGATCVLLINKTEESIDVSLDWKGAKPAGDAMLFTATGDSPEARDITFNGVKSPTPWKSDLPPPVAADMAKLQIPAYTIAVLRVK